MSKEFDEKQKEAFMEWVSGDSPLDFDIHAQDNSEWAWLQQFVPGVVISSAGGMLPFQAFGLIHGHPFYYREEWGGASIRVATLDGTPLKMSEVLWSASAEIADEFRQGTGWISTLMNLLENLEKASFRYDFPCKKIHFVEGKGIESAYVTDEIDKYGKCGWGVTPEDAYAQAKEPSAYLLENGWSVEEQERQFIMQEVPTVPSNVDERVYPDPAPVFEVRVPELWRDDNGLIEIPEEFFFENFERE